MPSSITINDAKKQEWERRLALVKDYQRKFAVEEAWLVESLKGAKTVTREQPEETAVR